MPTVIPAEMMGTAVQMVVYFFTMAAALLGFILCGRA